MGCPSRLPRVAAPWALALALLGACAPTGAEDRELAVAEEGPAPVGPRMRDAGAPRPLAGVDLFAEGCSALVVTPRGGWFYDGPWLEAVRRGWHPRAEYGRPFAIREAEGPVAVPGWRLWQVQVDGAPQELQPCFLPEAGPDPSAAHVACVPAWQLIGEATPEARPRTNPQWAQLLGLLDGARAVYPDETTLDRCAGSLPARVREQVPPLGLRTTGPDVEATFVERVDIGDELTLLVAVRATLEAGRLSVERRELSTMDREGGR